MFHLYFLAYGVVGLVVSAVTMWVFPPMEGFRPKFSVRLLAVTVFTVLWPVLVGLAVWYFGVGYLNRSRATQQFETSFDNQTIQFGTESGQIAVAKPRPR